MHNKIGTSGCLLNSRYIFMGPLIVLAPGSFTFVSPRQNYYKIFECGSRYDEMEFISNNRIQKHGIQLHDGRKRMIKGHPGARCPYVEVHGLESGGADRKRLVAESGANNNQQDK